ncbi:MAG: LuxR C-terminal-related transcriptional regulator [Ginsengibacter sp.]
MDTEYFSHLYEIASNLNKEFSLPAALRISLQKTVELLKLETGWIWLVQPDIQSVYLAASYNLPPALSNHPERLSGWCYCIEKYLSNDISKARNISEIACSRLKSIKTGTRDLKFHATIPITTQGQKVGLINLVSKESQKLNDGQLSLLNTIAELIGIAIQRTRLQESYTNPAVSQENVLNEIKQRILQPRIEELLSTLRHANTFLEQEQIDKALLQIKYAVQETEELQEQLSLIAGEAEEKEPAKNEKRNFHYPTSPLTNRELEVLTLVKKGLSNKQIAGQLFLAERTIKFHITSILSKLLAGNRTEAVNNAIQRGVLNN